ncbi:ScbR family autoregulator-binding transcription factor [Streptomyces lienomycini]|uniref:ScbR family autoregulator-binding transcription factor n=1 Tax=Streptomyces lienomycini TaxID=284035 RepID=A0ABV9X9P4_9ACTN
MRDTAAALDREFLMVKQERAARTRQSLVRAAAEAFAREGFTQASLTSISRRAGVSNGALHFHFESKQALARAVEEEACAALEAITRPGDGLGSALQRLVDATHALMGGLHQNVVVRAGFGLSGGFPRRADGVDVRGRWRTWVGQTLREAEAEGGLADGVSAADAALAVVAATVGFEQLGVADPAWTSEATLVRFWDLMLPRMAAPALAPRLRARCTRPLPAGQPRGAFTVRL